MINITSYDLKEIGGLCKTSRQNMGMPQRQVADDLHYTISNISSFENGENNNLLIFLWYVQNTNIAIFGIGGQKYE